MTASLLLAACLAATAAATAVLPATQAIWQGRTIRDEAAGTAAFAWEGTQVSFTVSGATSVSVSLSVSLVHQTTFHVYVDGVFNRQLDVKVAGQTDYEVVSGLTAGSHLIHLWYIIDPIALAWPVISPGNISIFSFSTDGTFGPAPPTLPRRLLIIGDSITAGNQINNVTCQPDHSGTYEAQLCSSFNANCTTLAISGFGLYENCCPALENITMSSLVPLVIPSDLTTLWDNAAFVPDGIMINLGTNDNARFNGSQAWIDGFVHTYAQFLMNLTATHGNNKNLPIFCTMGPITKQPMEWIQAAVSIAEAKGLTNLHMLNYTTPLDRCGHPDYASHTLMYEQARPLLSQVLGWQ